MWKKYLLICIGWVSVGLGLIGILLPILPTTPFMILAASCFAKSSERFHRWLLNSPVFGSIIKEWQATRSVTLRVKIWSITVVLITFSISIYVVTLTAVRIFLILMLAACLYGMSRVPVRRSNTAVKQSFPS